MATGSVKQIWRDDLEVGMEELKNLSDRFPYVAVSVVWPGFVSRPITFQDYAYSTIKDTVNLCDPLQIGFSFAESHGRKPSSSLQFNFVYHSTRNCVVEENIEAFVERGYDCVRAQTNGVDLQEFGECLMGSGVLMSERIKWITYHGAYDYGFLLKALTNSSLPACKEQFADLLKEYFVSHYDVKYMLSKVTPKNEVPGTLRAACSTLGLSTLPIITNADASIRGALNALLTSACFFHTVKRNFENRLDDARFNSVLYGIDDIEEVRLPPGMLRLKPGTYNGPPSSD